MKFFSDCKSENEKKTIYRKLAKCFHPDKGGSVELMVELKKQYDEWKLDSIYENILKEGFKQDQFSFKINRHSTIPHDHPIHDEIRYWKEKKNYFEKLWVDNQNLSNTYYNFFKQKELEVFNLKEKIPKLNDRIMELISENEVLKNKMPKTIWEYLRIKYEKQS